MIGSKLPPHEFLMSGLTIVNGTINITVYDKRDNFKFQIVNFPFIISNIPAGLSCGIYILTIGWDRADL